MNSPKNYNSVLIYYSHVVPNLYNMFSSMEHKREYLKKKKIVTPIKKDKNAP